MSDDLGLACPDDARRLIERFNGFHDGFILELRLRSRDRFSKHGPEPWEVGHRVTGRFDAVLDIAHYNYGETPQPPGRIVRCRFADVSDFLLDLREVRSYEWPIQNTSIDAAERRREDGRTEPCFRLGFLWSALDGQRWTTRSAELLRFQEARFEELDPAPGR